MKDFQSENCSLNLKVMTTTVLIIMVIMMQYFHTAESVISAIAQPGCQDTCGGLSIPYPFGIGPHCSMGGFEVECNTIYTPPKLILHNTAVNGISLPSGQVVVYNPISSVCYNNATSVEYIEYHWNLSGTPFFFNNEKNKFTVMGCETLAFIHFGNETNLNWGGCVLVSSSPRNIIDGSCSGIGCCQTSIPPMTNYYRVQFDTGYNNSDVYNFSRCGYALLVPDNEFKFNSDYITTNKLYDQQSMPIVLDWSIGNETCEIALANKSSYACISDNSVCVESTNGRGYFCNCSIGYEGNPYLPGGCTDIDECANRNICSKKCHNLPGTYRCSCPALMRLRKNSAAGSCELYVPYLIGLTILLGFTTSIVGLLIYFAIAKRIKLFEKRKQEKLKQQFFIQNRGLLLQQLLTNHEHTTENMRIFRLDELETATNRFDNALILGKGGHGEVYKGILLDQRVVAIKRSKIADQCEVDQFINEVVILSQVNHRNVVKLFGCCLETEVPLLVYEFISNGSLYDHLHVKEHCSLTWKQRLKIAIESAGAISYLHSSASISVFHRDIKSSNILLDDYFTAKVSDFGASRSVQIDQTGITTAIQGTYGYLDPEYYYTGRLTQKSDVYSFGVILAELLTRENPFSSSGSIVAYFGCAMKENHLFEILDPEVVYEENRKDLEAVAKLAEMCLRMKGEERPTMKEVEVRLEVLCRSNEQHNHPWTSQNLEGRELKNLITSRN